MEQEELPLSWKISLLAIIPGLLAAPGWASTDVSTWILAGVILPAAFLGYACWRTHWQLPAWSLVAAGMLASVGLMIASGVIAGLVTPLLGGSADVLEVLGLSTALVALWRFCARARRTPPLVWALSAAIVVCQLAVRAKHLVLSGVSWPVAVQWLSISLYAVVFALLLPVALGLCLAQRYGLLAMLFVIGMIYARFEILIDVNRKASGQMGSTFGLFACRALIPLLFTVVAPLWFLRARSSHSRVCGLLALVGLAVVLDLAIVSLLNSGNFPLLTWISFIPYTVSVLLTLACAHLLYQERSRRPTMA